MSLISGILGPGVRHVGDMEFSGRVRIDGEFTGAITSPDFLEVGVTGSVSGDIQVAQALIAGHVDGMIRASERVTILETAVIRGQIMTPWLDIRPGAQLRAEVIAERTGNGKTND